MRIQERNFAHLEGWMRTELGLRGNELITYAVIYGYSQDGGWCNCSAQYIADWCGVTKRAMLDILARLVEKGLLEKKETIKNLVKFCSYRCKNCAACGEETSYGGGEETSSNTKYNILKEDTYIIKKESKKEETFDSIIDDLVVDDELKNLLKEHLKMRALNKWSKLTNEGWRRNITKLLKDAGNEENAKEIVGQSLEKGWRGFFPVKKAQPQPARRPEQFSNTTTAVSTTEYYQEQPGEDVTWKRVFDDWERKLNIRPEPTVANVEAVKKLLKLDGEERVGIMVTALAMREKTGYLSKTIKEISEPVHLLQRRSEVWMFYLNNKQDWEWKYGRPGKESWEL